MKTLQQERHIFILLLTLLAICWVILAGQLLAEHNWETLIFYFVGSFFTWTMTRLWQEYPK